MEIYFVCIWIRLQHFPIIYKGDDIFKSIGDKSACYSTFSYAKENILSYAKICVEMGFAKGLSEAIQLHLDSWSHL